MQRSHREGLLTADQAARDQGENHFWELWDGILLVCEPSGGGSGPLGIELGAFLREAMRRGRRGWVGDSSTGYLVRRDPDRLLSPDVSYVSRERLERWPERGFVPCVPELAAEIRSSRDTWTKTVERGGIWIAHGVEVVWLVDPFKRRVVTMRPAEDPVEAGAGGTFSAAPVLPLDVSVDELFSVLD